MNYILFDGPNRNNLLPLTYTRPVADIRIGILTIREKWEMYLGVLTTTMTEDYLSEKYPMKTSEHNILINASYLPTPDLVDIIQDLKDNQAVFYKGSVVAYSTNDVTNHPNFETYDRIDYEDDLIAVLNSWDIFFKNGQAISDDFILVTKNKVSQPIPETTVAFNPSQIFIEKGAKLPLCSLNAETGPIYIGKDTEIMEGSMIRGPFALCDNATVKMAAKIYGPTTIGPHSKVGGEINNSVLFGYSNKAHDGFLGNSVLGEWCNLGADTNNSNLKNNFAEVRLWDYTTAGFSKTGLQFCGLIMGDHSKCGINTMFNTGTVVGVSANIFGSGFPRNFVPSFSWGGNKGFTTYLTKKAFEVATIVMLRRNVEFTDEDAKILEHVFEMSKSYRGD